MSETKGKGEKEMEYYRRMIIHELIHPRSIYNFEYKVLQCSCYSNVCSLALHGVSMLIFSTFVPWKKIIRVVK